MGRAVAVFDAVVNATPDGADHEAAVANLAGALITQYEMTRDADLLDRAISILEQALRKPSVVSARRAIYLSLLGRALRRGALRERRDYQEGRQAAASGTGPHA
jgi:hypothetical protein